MQRKVWPLIMLNIITTLTVCLIGYIGADIVRCVIANDEDNGYVSMDTGLTIALVALIIATIFIVTTVSLAKGIFKKRLQKLAAILLVFLICIVDASVGRHFHELRIIGQVAIIYINILCILEMIGSLVTAAIWDKQPSSIPLDH